VARKQLVVFKVGTEEFAVDIMLTREVVLMHDITPVPETDAYVEGVMNLRGHLLPVLDLRKRLRASRQVDTRDRRIIVTFVEGRVAGLIVDGASEVIRVSDDMIEPVPNLISEIGAAYVQAVVNLNNRFITLIDVEKAFSQEVVGELDHVIEYLSRGREQIAPAQAV
jgi:purine-binding chemotaxis protein CheW